MSHISINNTYFSVTQLGDLKFVVKEPTGEVIADATFESIGRELKASMIKVSPLMQRKGVASALYDHVEKITQKKIVCSQNLTLGAFNFWNKRDPSQVQSSLYHFNDQLLNKEIQGNKRIVEVRNKYVSTIRNNHSGFVSPLYKNELEKMNIIPFDQKRFDEWIKDSMLINNDGSPILCYHASDKEFDVFNTDIAYFTSNPNYQYIKQLEHIKTGYVSIKRPFMVDRVSDIESMRSNPAKIRVLREMGYDSVVYADPSNLTKGASGWGNDSSQYVLFDPNNQFKSLDLFPVDISINQKIKPLNVLSVFHATNDFFIDFDVSSDVGFHFGTKTAALDRAKKLSSPEVTIEHNEISPMDKLCFEISQGKEPCDMREELYYIFLRKLSFPKSSLIETISEMPLAEVNSLIKEYQVKDDSNGFISRCERGKGTNGYVVSIDNQERFTFTREAEAKACKKIIESTLLKKVHLRLSNPIRTSDLGQWDSTLIGREVGLKSEEMSLIYEADSKADKYKILISLLESKGFDGIVYQNAVEDAGSDSYIVFNKAQIVQCKDNTRVFNFLNERSSINFEV